VALLSVLRFWGQELLLHWFGMELRIIRQEDIILDFKLSLCFECRMLSSG
jgi:hypothetical protein